MDGAARYEVYNNTSGTPLLVGTAEASAASFTVTGLEASTTYVFRVNLIDTAEKKDGNTNDATVTTLAASSPADVLPLVSSLKLWLKSTTGIVKDGSDHVSLWKDQSGNGNDLSQGESSQQPLWANNLVNSRPAIQFDGSSDSLVAGGLDFDDKPQTIFFVLRSPSASSFNALLAPISTSFYYGFDSALTLGLSDGAAFSSFGTSLQSGRFSVVTFRSAGISAGNITAEGWLDGALMTNAPAASGLGSGTGLMVGAASGSVYLLGDIAELILYDTQLGVSDRESVENYLGARYAITINH